MKHRNRQKWVWPYRRNRTNLEAVLGTHNWGIFHDIGFSGDKLYTAGVYDLNSGSFVKKSETFRKRSEALNYAKRHGGLSQPNPRVKLPANWTPAKVRVLPSGDVQIGLSQNPLSAKGGRFAKCVKSVEAKGGAYDPRAVCGAMEKRRKRNPIEYRFVNEGGGRGYFVSTRKRPGKGRVVSLPRGYTRDSDGVYRRPKNWRKKNGKRKTLKRVAAALKKYVRGNPVRTFEVHIPATRYDKGYRLTIKAKTKASARAEAKRYCATQWSKYTGHPASQYKLPAKTKVREV